MLAASILSTGSCGGAGSGGTPISEGPSPDDLVLAQMAFLQSSLDVATNRVTLSWTDAFLLASRYQIERQRDDGGWDAIDAVAGTQAPQGALYWTGSVYSATSLRVEAMLSGYSVPLVTLDGDTSIRVAPPADIPDITLDQSQPVQGVVGVSLVHAGRYASMYYSTDSGARFGPAASDPPYATTLDSSTMTTGSHELMAWLRTDFSSSLLVRKSLTVHTSTAAASIAITQEPSVSYVDVLATSDSGIAAVDISVGGLAAGSLTAPTSCAPQPCQPGQAFNVYRFPLDPRALGNGYHPVAASVVDADGNTALAQSSVDFPCPTTATLDSPADATVVEGLLHLSGTFASGSTGALELRVTLSGIEIYHETVANPGTIVPYSTDVDLSGTAPGDHTVDVYARVGHESYRLLASAMITMVGGH